VAVSISWHINFAKIRATVLCGVTASGHQSLRGRPRADHRTTQTKSIHLRHQRGAQERRDRTHSGAVLQVLQEEGFAKLRDVWTRSVRRALGHGGRSCGCPAAESGARTIPTKFGGLFLFLRRWWKWTSTSDRPVGPARHPDGSAAHACGACCIEIVRHPAAHACDERVLDEGLALFAGLNVIPSVRSSPNTVAGSPACYPKLMQHWFDAMTGLGLQHGSRSTSTSTPSHSTAKTHFWRSITFLREPSPEGNSGLFGQDATNASSVTPMPTCGRSNKTTRFCSL